MNSVGYTVSMEIGEQILKEGRLAYEGRSAYGQWRAMEFIC